VTASTGTLRPAERSAPDCSHVDLRHARVMGSDNADNNGISTLIGDHAAARSAYGMRSTPAPAGCSMKDVLVSQTEGRGRHQ
jgi:hypothetical protein